MPLPTTTYDRVPIEPGIRPGTPSAAWMAPLRDSQTSFAEVPLARGVVVVTVHRLGALRRLTDPLLEAGHDPVHHLFAVEQRELLRPPQLADVAIELDGPLDHQVRQVAVGQLDPRPLAQPLRHLDVVLRDAVADAARTRVQDSQTRSSSSRLTSMKWLPDPRLPSCN